jgi:uncharacterized protein DUF4912
MSSKNPKRRWRKSKYPHDFRISDRSIVLSAAEPATIVRESDSITPPPVHGAPVLVAVARDPRTIFLYWRIDWPALFADTVPTDRQVHLRVYRVDSDEPQSLAIEPLASNCYVTVPPRSGPYHVEMGYYQPADVWHSITTSNEVAMPRGELAVNRDVDLATIPLHLKFQRLLDLLGAANGVALAETISQFQARVSARRPRKSPSANGREILTAMNLSPDEIAAARRAFISHADEAALDRIAEAILIFESASPSHWFSPSSWQGARAGIKADGIRSTRVR